MDLDELVSLLERLKALAEKKGQSLSVLFNALVEEAEEDHANHISFLEDEVGSPLFSDPDDLAKIRVRESEDEEAFYSRYGDGE